MSTIQYVTILLLAVKSSVLLDDLEYLESLNFGHHQGYDSISTKISQSNCSQYESDPDFELQEFQGDWNYIRFYTLSPLPLPPRCMKLKSKIKERKILMEVSLPLNRQKNGNSAKSVSLRASMDRNKKRQDIPGVWSLFSKVYSLAPSKWIVLFGNREQVLYMICGNLPDQKSRVGEIGILSRGKELSDHDAAGFQRILANYSLDEVLDYVSQDDCE